VDAGEGIPLRETHPSRDTDQFGSTPVLDSGLDLLVQFDTVE
jgi:hypothetical protein